MFERIARRHADRPDEPDATTPAADAEAPAVTTDQPTSEIPAGDAPTERIDMPVAEPVVPPVAPATDAAPPAAPAPDAAQPAPSAPEQGDTAVIPRRAGFRARGRMRRRLRYLRKLRDLQVRDLGGLVFDLRRFGRSRDDLIAQKIDHIRACDDELRALELTLAERRELRDVREPGIGGTCPRCFAVHGSADRFCANCGAALGGAVQGPAHLPPQQ